MRHLDLFSGIGGFAYAADQVFGDVEHIFCDNDKFCQQVLRKHWPEAKIYGDIRSITTNPFSEYGGGKDNVGDSDEGRTASQDRRTGVQPQDWQTHTNNLEPSHDVDLLTGGFPCQPFSAAGLRRGTADERHLWPEMLRVIRLTKPTWVIAENVRGLVTWNDGLVLEQVCADLEANGYEVQPLIIPAVAVNAPHRRDRIWFIGHAEHDGQHGIENREGVDKRSDSDTSRPDELEQPARPDSLRQDAADTTDGRRRQRVSEREAAHDISESSQRHSWEQDWPEVAAELCSLDDGLPARLGGFELSKSQHRKEQLKAYGNAIVPQVAMQIMEAIKEAIDNPTTVTKGEVDR